MLKTMLFRKKLCYKTFYKTQKFLPFIHFHVALYGKGGGIVTFRVVALNMKSGGTSLFHR